MNAGFALDTRFGANPRKDGSTRFRLWAPGQETVSVAVEGGPLVPMARSPDGWFDAVAACPVGTRYRYRLADGMLVPDPASRAQANDVHDPSIVIDPRSYAWRNTDWRGRPWRERRAPSRANRTSAGRAPAAAGTSARFRAEPS